MTCIPTGRLSWWETTKALALILGATAALFGTLAGIAGYDMARPPPPEDAYW